MSVLALTLPGKFVDAYVYADRLLAWERSGTILSWNMSRLATIAAEEGHLPRRLAKAALDDNRLFSDEGTESPRSDEAFVIECPPDSIAPTDMSGIALYDLLVTRFTVFMSTSEGLFSLWLRQGLADPTVDGVPELRMAGRVLGADYHFGGIVVAAGHRGTWALVNEFGFSKKAYRGVTQFTHETAAESGWFGQTLYEMDDDGNHRFYSAVLHEGSRARGSKRRNPRVVVGVERYHEDAVYLPILREQGGQLASSVSPSKGRRLIFPVRSSLVRQVNRQLWVSPVGRWSGAFTQRADAAVIAENVTDVWDVVETDGGYAVETRAGVFGVEEERYVEVSSRPVISIRAYPNSRRYRRLVTTTSSSGLTVICMTGAHPYPKSKWYRTDDDGGIALETERWGDLFAIRVAPPGTPGSS